MLHTKIRGIQSTGSRGEDFKGFYHIWAWWPSWLCDLDHLYKLLFPYPNDTVVILQRHFEFCHLFRC